MAYTFLQAVNETLKLVKVIHGDAGELTSFVDTSRQENIDIARRVWNELIHQLYTLELFSRGARTGQFVIATGVREYDIEPDFEAMASDAIRNEAKYWKLDPYKGGYIQMWDDQVDPSNYSGQPLAWAINPESDKIRIDRDPTSTENGDIYKYLYYKRLYMQDEGDVFPFSDTVVDSLIRSSAEMWKRDREKDFDAGMMGASFNRAVSYLTQARPKSMYGRHA